MRELLFFPENLTQPLQWATANADGQLALHDPILPAAFGQQAKGLTKKGVVLILPGQQVASYRFAMPKVSGQAKQQAIAFALEGLCSQPLDDVYVIAGDYIDGKQSAMVVAKNYLDGVLLLAKDKHLKVVGIRVDYMLLKMPELGAWTAARLGNDILWRTDQGTGGRVEVALWPFILQQVFDQNNEPPKEVVWTTPDGGEKPPQLSDDLQKLCAEAYQRVPSWLDQSALMTPSLYSFNTGENKLRALFNKRKKTISLAIKVVVGAVVFALVSQIAFTAFVQIKLSKEQALLHKWLVPLGFGNLSLDEIKQRLKNSIEAVEKVQSADGFTYGVSAVTHALSASQKADLQNLTYDAKQGLVLTLPNKDTAAVMQSLKTQMPEYQIKLLSAKKTKQVPTTAKIQIHKVVA
jgi:hypothetical protein